ncbi:MAG TPA: copper resistance protein CopC, partial [Candidatus Dormibacteraeota bacterium]|nr:copper resistance protein CopC [Candidatus Dormibacteraeota bacterium]
MRRLVLGLLALLVALGAAAATPPLRAAAHALRQSSVPDSGANVPQSPAEVVITFGEEPDPRLSSIQVISTSGQQYSTGPTTQVPGNPLELRVAVKTLPMGVYTVSWRTFSHVDGHVAGGAFNFGVRQDPSSVAVTPVAAGPPGPDAADIIGRSLLFVGLIVLVGGAGVAIMALPRPAGAVLRTLPAGWLLATAGTATVVASQAHNAGAQLGDLFTTSIGRSLVERSVPLVITLVALLFLRGGDTRRRVAVSVAGLGGALAMLADVLNSHAAAGSNVALNSALQWIHIAAGALWLGGLLALLIGIRGLSGEVRGRAVRRFSTAAGIALVLVAASGTVRAIVEVGAWDQLTSTTFGKLVLAKIALLLVLAGLGAVNRFGNVPKASRLVRGLQRVGSTEVMVALGALVVAAALVNEEPPASIRAAAAKLPQPLVINAHDYGTSVNMRLTVTPGSTGPNLFSAYLTDYDSGKPIDPAGVQLGFTAPTCQSLGPTTLVLKRSAPGTWTATGSNLALGTSWQVTALVDRGSASVEIPLTINPKLPPQKLSVTPGGNGLPTLYNIDLPLGKLQIYIDPEQAGKVEFHTTYIDAAGNGLDATVNSVVERGV